MGNFQDLGQLRKQGRRRREEHNARGFRAKHRTSFRSGLEAKLDRAELITAGHINARKRAEADWEKMLGEKRRADIQAANALDAQTKAEATLHDYTWHRTLKARTLRLLSFITFPVRACWKFFARNFFLKRKPPPSTP